MSRTGRYCCAGCAGTGIPSIRHYPRLALFGLILAALLMFGPWIVEDARPIKVMVPAHSVDADSHRWQVSESSWYGPGFYGNITACGQRYDSTIQGVAHKTLACGTLVRFEWHGRELVVPVIDRGPYTEGREWDLTHGACEYLGRCFTANIAWTL